MTASSLDVVLKDLGNGVWASGALNLPKARAISVLDNTGAPVPFEVRGNTVSVGNTSGPLVARVELPETLVEESALDRAKVDLERERLALEERGGRRTLWISLATAVVSAAAAIGVALVTNLTGPSRPVAVPAPAAYRDLVACRENLNVIASLKDLDQQTLQTLRDAIGRHVDICKEKLDLAIAASPP